MTDIIPQSLSEATKVACNELDIDESIGQALMNCVVKWMIICLEHEIPFTIKGFGKFYHSYRNRKKENNFDHDASFYNGKKHKCIEFEVNHDVITRLHGWVHDLNITNNNSQKEVSKLLIKPDEIYKFRKMKMLEEQRSLGFDSSLLFDEDKVPDIDKDLIKNVENSPSVKEIMKRLGVDIDAE